eukprot:TRINITY_DN1993_c0_g1_i2.p2 TRINITY_DN1993_c0_g1~~TRINITY_DN1993_c0_g1_i2.p2  ORF type:complete len:107 (-),score=18.28 TRINITY_DN1993_c0_g1_i2:486-806(-)
MRPRCLCFLNDKAFHTTPVSFAEAALAEMNTTKPTTFQKSASSSKKETAVSGLPHPRAGKADGTPNFIAGNNGHLHAGKRRTDESSFPAKEHIGSASFTFTPMSYV